MIEGCTIKITIKRLKIIFVIINLHFIYFTFFYNKYKKLDSYELDSFSDVIKFVDEDKNVAIEINNFLNVRSEIRYICLGKEKDANVLSNKYLTICSYNKEEECVIKDIFYLDKGVLFTNSKYYQIYNYQELVKYLDNYTNSYCNVVDAYKYDNFNKFYKDNILTIRIYYYNQERTLDLDKSYELIKKLRNVPHDVILPDLEVLPVNYKIVIAFKNNRTIIYDYNGVISIENEGESCTKYYIRRSKYRDEIGILLNNLING